MKIGVACDHAGFEYKEELNRFTEEFYSCFIDEEGKPYFLID